MLDASRFAYIFAKLGFFGAEGQLQQYLPGNVQRRRLNLLLGDLGQTPKEGRGKPILHLLGTPDETAKRRHRKGDDLGNGYEITTELCRRWLEQVDIKFLGSRPDSELH
jgi:hypothetical protein